MNILLLTGNGLIFEFCCFEEIYGNGAGYRKRERNAISIVTRQMRYGKEKRKGGDSTVGPDMDSLFFSLDLATSSRYARASLDDATDYATSLE